MGRTPCTEPQCLYKGALYLNLEYGGGDKECVRSLMETSVEKTKLMKTSVEKTKLAILCIWNDKIEMVVEGYKWFRIVSKSGFLYQKC